eukprot:TRINITY_DN13173_c0_g2_i7.p1 TRINITY_DN13173_c0_g2~~TRINITY_DN13173_c0_g2_i7.p1  ORF type:complete len:129 (+),score=24.82 TRINITY_DN13173_c0_g2_i7:93-479(+)
MKAIQEGVKWVLSYNRRSQQDEGNTPNRFASPPQLSLRQKNYQEGCILAFLIGSQKMAKIVPPKKKKTAKAAVNLAQKEDDDDSVYLTNNYGEDKDMDFEDDGKYNYNEPGDDDGSLLPIEDTAFDVE